MIKHMGWFPKDFSIGDDLLTFHKIGVHGCTIIQQSCKEQKNEMIHCRRQNALNS